MVFFRCSQYLVLHQTDCNGNSYFQFTSFGVIAQLLISGLYAEIKNYIFLVDIWKKETHIEKVISALFFVALCYSFIYWNSCLMI